jgi:hypothetical protein
MWEIENEALRRRHNQDRAGKVSITHGNLAELSWKTGGASFQLIFVLWPPLLASSTTAVTTPAIVTALHPRLDLD